MGNAFQMFADAYAAYGYPILFLGVMLENLGLPVPGETAVLAAGFLSSPAGGLHLHLAMVIPITFVAAVLGDNLSFWIGRRVARPRLKRGQSLLLLNAESLAWAEGYFARYGIWTVFFGRFVTGLRVIGAMAAGVAGMPWRRFVFADAAGALVWAVTISLLGYFFGQSWHLVHRWLGWGGVAAVVIVLAVIAVWYFGGRARRIPPQGTAEPSDSAGP
jgi:membrane protein DedA with SNARE-associated domain